MSGPKLRHGAVAALAVLVAAVGLAIGSTSQAAPPSGEPAASATTETPGIVDCEITFESEYSFGTGSIFKITITAGDQPVQGWNIDWRFSGDTQITHVFDVPIMYEQSGQVVHAKNHLMWGYLDPGESVSGAFLVDTPWMSQVPEYAGYCKDTPW